MNVLLLKKNMSLVGDYFSFHFFVLSTIVYVNNIITGYVSVLAERVSQIVF